MTTRAALVTVLARLLAMGGPFGVSVITARALGPEDRGLYFLVVSYAQIAAQVGNMGLQSSNTYLVAANPERVRAILTNSLIVSLTLGPLTALPFVWWFGSDSTSEVWTSSLLAVALAPLMILFLLVSNIAVAIGRVALYNLLIILSGVLALASAMTAAWLGSNVTQFLWAAVTSLVLASLFGVLALMPQCGWSLRPSFKLFQNGVFYSIRAYLATLGGFLMNRVGILVLESQMSMTVVGQFSVAQQINQALMLLPSTVGLLLMPSLVRMPTRAERAAETRKIALKLASAMAVLLILLGLLTPFFVPFVFGDVYTPAVPFILAFLPSVFLLSIIIVVSQFLSAEGFPATQVAVWILATLLHTVMTVLLIPKLGAMAIPVSFTINTILILFGLILIATHLTRRNRSDA